jgi:nucleotide-binding universal stress UspA family protein
VPAEGAIKKILIANNGSEGACKALAEALRLAQSYESEAHMIYVEENIRWNAPETGEGKKTLDRKFAELVAKAEAEAEHHGVKLKSHMVLGRPAEAIADFLLSRGGFDLLVVGFNGHSALYHRILGKTGDRLVELAPCAVLVVK